MRSKYGEFPEYHTSLDDLNLVTPSGLAGGFLAYRRILQCIEGNCYPRVTVLCEPQLGKRGLYPTLSTRNSGMEARAMTNLIAYCDGSTSLLEIAERIHQPMWDLMPMIARLADFGLVEKQDFPAPKEKAAE
jgi:aminopeptidase-like protein